MNLKVGMIILRSSCYIKNSKSHPLPEWVWWVHTTHGPKSAILYLRFDGHHFWQEAIYSFKRRICEAEGLMPYTKNKVRGPHCFEMVIAWKCQNLAFCAKLPLFSNSLTYYVYTYHHWNHQRNSCWRTPDWGQWCEHPPLWSSPYTKVAYPFILVAGHRQVWGGGGGQGGALPPKNPLCPHKWLYYTLWGLNTCSTLPACAVLTELRDRDGVKVITDYTGLHSGSKETKVLAPLTPPEVLNFKPTHAGTSRS